MFDLNPPAGDAPGHQDDDASGTPSPDTSTPTRMKCLCGHCATCRSATLLQEDMNPTDHAVGPQAGNASRAPQKTTQPPCMPPTDVMTRRCIAELHGRRGATRRSAQHAQPLHSGQTLGELLLQMSRHVRSASHLTQTARAVEAFERRCGVKAVERIGVEDVGLFVHTLQMEGASDATVLRLVQTLSSLVRAWADGGNPFQPTLQRMRRQYRPAYRIGPLPSAELQQLLTSPDFVAARDSAKGGDTLRFWLPLTALLTGAHASELVGARVTDLVRHGETWMLHLPERTREGQWSTSTPSRWFPLHEELVLCGFVAYARRRELEGHTYLFAAKAGERAASSALAAARRWYSRLASCLRLPQGQRSLSSLRHCFITAAAATDMPFHWLHRVATGRWPRQGPWLGTIDLHSLAVAQRLAEFVARVRFDGVDFSHLHVPLPFTGVDALPGTVAAGAETRRLLTP